MTNKPLLLITLAIGFLATSAPLIAHHGATNVYDFSKPVVLKGTITKFEWLNPHNQIYFDVTDEKGTVSHWIAALKGGDPAAAQPLWERYYRQLVALARKKLQSARRRAADEEDVVQNAFHSFFRAVAQGRFPHVDDRDSLWRLLVVITANKALRQLTHEHRQKRGGGTAAGPVGIYPVGPEDEAALVQVVGEALGGDQLQMGGLWVEGHVLPSSTMSRARRRPLNCQRAAGGKKLR